MKAKLLAIAVTALISTSAFAAEGEAGIVNFTGNIVEATCSLTEQSLTKGVVLGDVATSAFAAAGATSTAKDFTIELEGCDVESAKTTSITFSGEHAGDDAVVSANPTVGIQLMENNAPLKLDTPSSAVSIDAETVTLPFAARYIALAEEVTAGAANGTANFTVAYN